MKTLLISGLSTIGLLLLMSFKVTESSLKKGQPFSCSTWTYDNSIITAVNYTSPPGVAIFFNDQNENETVEIYGPNGYSAWASVPQGGFYHFAVPSSGLYNVYVNYNNSCLVGAGSVVVP